MATVPPPSTAAHYHEILRALWEAWRSGTTLVVAPLPYPQGPPTSPGPPPKRPRKPRKRA